jgi:hypothetical protein
MDKLKKTKIQINVKSSFSSMLIFTLIAAVPICILGYLSNGTLKNINQIGDKIMQATYLDFLHFAHSWINVVFDLLEKVATLYIALLSLDIATDFSDEDKFFSSKMEKLQMILKNIFQYLASICFLVAAYYADLTKFVNNSYIQDDSGLTLFRIFIIIGAIATILTLIIKDSRLLLEVVFNIFLIFYIILYLIVYWFKTIFGCIKTKMT